MASKLNIQFKAFPWSIGEIRQSCKVLADIAHINLQSRASSMALGDDPGVFASDRDHLCPLNSKQDLYCDLDKLLNIETV